MKIIRIVNGSTGDGNGLGTRLPRERDNGLRRARAAMALVSCPAGKIGGKIRLITLCTILGTPRKVIRALIGVIEAT